MRYARLSLVLLRMGIGLYLIFTAIVRIMAPSGRDSLVSLYSTLGLVPVERGALATAITAFIAILGVLLLSGRLLVLTGLLVMVLGLCNGVAELVMSQAESSLATADRLSLLTLGLRDLLVLASAGLAISSLDELSRIDKARVMSSNVSMLPEAREAVPPRRD
ncbi:hypothetical protein D3C86_1548900 [compost metagenome]